MSDRLSGTLTFLFTDIQGSTQLWDRHPREMAVALARHDAVLRGAIEGHSGHVFKTIGDAFCAAFRTAPEGLAAAVAAQRTLLGEPGPGGGPLLVRMALHTGVAEERDGDYFGPPLNRIARLLSTGHGGQVLLSLATQELTRDVLPADLSLLDLGEHRLKDLSRPEWIFQVVAPGLPAELPPLRTLDAHPNNLPAQRNPLVGREQEVETARLMLLREDVGLLTLTGPGGTGKSRLALQVAADLIDEFEHGAYFVPLAAVFDPSLVAGVIARTLGVVESGKPLAESLKGFFRGKQMLLVLDNFEQVLEAAPLVGELLDAAPRLKVLATSRAVLRVYGEHELPVPPLALPDPRRLPTLEVLSQYAAVMLFTQRATAVKPDFRVTNENAAAVAEICARLDGLPLAIELAAARVKLLSPAAILGRLESSLKLLTGGARDLPARQQTLRGAIAWGYDLLDESEQTLFRRLSVFSGGCTLEAAEAVCDPDREFEVDVLDGLSSLLDKSLLRQEETEGREARFVMLQTIREFGLEQLEAHGEGEILRRHADYCLVLAAEAETKLRGPGQAAWLDRLDAEHDNLRAALRWLQASGDAEGVLRLVSELWWFWYLRTYISEGRRWSEAALAGGGWWVSGVGRTDRETTPAPNTHHPTSALARVLLGSGGLAMLQSDYPMARERLEQALATYGKLGDRVGAANSLTYLGQIAHFQSDRLAARGFLGQSEAVFREVGDRWGLALALFFRGNTELLVDDYEAARVAFDESLALFRGLGDSWGIARPLAVLGRVALRKGDYAGARAMLEEGLLLSQRSGDRWGQAHQLNGLGDAARQQGDYARARALYRESIDLYRETGNKNGIASALHNLGYVALAGNDPWRAGELFGESLALFEELEDRRGVAECLAGLAGAIAASGDARRAAGLFGASEAQLEAIEGRLSASNQVEYDRNIALTRAALDDAGFAEAWVEGRAMTREQASKVARLALAATRTAEIT